LKIKCPFEPFEIAPDYTKGGLSLHLQEDHEVREVIADYFTNIIFKIHEKIEQIHPNESFEQWKKNTLKSLLEDKN